MKFVVVSFFLAISFNYKRLSILLNSNRFVVLSRSIFYSDYFSIGFIGEQTKLAHVALCHFAKPYPIVGKQFLYARNIFASYYQSPQTAL